MGDDSLTLTPVYSFEWADGTERRTDDAGAFAEEPSPDAIEELAAIGRAADDCEVTLLGMGS